MRQGDLRARCNPGAVGVRPQVVKPEQEESFADFVAMRSAGVRRLALAVTGDWHRADDLAQDVFVKLYLAWPLREPAGGDVWLQTTLVRTWIDETRRP